MDIKTYRGTFDDAELVRLFERSKGQQVVLGKANQTFENHPKPYSLCYWLRQRFNRSAQRLLTDEVIAALRETGRYNFRKITDPETGRQVQGIVLANATPNGG